MNLDSVLDARGKHSLFSPSNPSFLNYDPSEFYTKLMERYRKNLGDEIHEFAYISIKRCHKVTNSKELVKDIDSYIFQKYENYFSTQLYKDLTSSGYTIDERRAILKKECSRELSCLRYVACNYPQAIETVRSYINDAIGFKMHPEVVLKYTDDFRGKADALLFDKNTLRIHDLKTGSGPVHLEQLLGYAALFCLQYHITPSNLSMELRIYQNGDVLIVNPTGDDVQKIIDTYRTFAEVIRVNEEVTT